MIPVALSDTQNLTLLIALLMLGGMAIICFAYYAFRQKGLQDQIEAAVGELTKSVNDKVSQSGAEGDGADNVQASILGAADYLKAMAELAGKLAELSPPVAALVISTIPFFLAATLLGIQLLS